MDMKLYTTFRLLRVAGACRDRCQYGAVALGGVATYGADAPIPLVRVLEINGLDDALWALRAVPPEQAAERDRLARLFACDCAGRALPVFEQLYPTDRRPREAIAMARRFAGGEATANELAAARAAAWAAARDAAGDAAWAAARAAAWAAARDAAWDAAWAAWDAARAAAWDAERGWQAAHLREALEGGK